MAVPPVPLSLSSRLEVLHVAASVPVALRLRALRLLPLLLLLPVVVVVLVLVLVLVLQVLLRVLLLLLLPPPDGPLLPSCAHHQRDRLHRLRMSESPTRCRSPSPPWARRP